MLYVKLKHKETDGNSQEQTGTDRKRQDLKETDRNSRNRQDYSSDIENYSIIKKFISEIGKREVVVFSGTRLPLRKSITMRWKSVGTTADVGGRRQDGGTVK